MVGLGAKAGPDDSVKNMQIDLLPGGIAFALDEVLGYCPTVVLSNGEQVGALVLDPAREFDGEPVARQNLTCQLLERIRMHPLGITRMSLQPDDQLLVDENSGRDH